jgi:hypothetical protein
MLAHYVMKEISEYGPNIGWEILRKRLANVGWTSGGKFLVVVKPTVMFDFRFIVNELYNTALASLRL